MGNALSGYKVVLAGTRKTDEMSTLIEKQGGTPLVRSLQGTVFRVDDEVLKDLETFISKGADWAILTTGIGTNTLVELAERIGKKDEFLARLKEANIAARGYKTKNVIKQLGLQAEVVDNDGTVSGLVAAMEGADVTGKRVMVQLHGENAPKLLAFLEEKGADIQTLLPYRHTPAKEETMAQFFQEIEERAFDAVCFTAAIQVRELFTYAKKNNMKDLLVEAFQRHVIAVSVGKVTTEALQDEGIKRIVAPKLERMGAMIVALASYVQEEKSR
ncbi:uroporphyrinogen-III synthase [Halalkalibacterium halodurans]|uniref:BH2162 protein n=1 Tax=Halalkalibacterium halodurans (strain ATCC BAA-125 / DSM 18197 / FERM 7344 / JCM 9153 / C-125) TaxID=272558 RepID=Q9KAX4_HALH5|nr:uroporphyrinogen-III synthase [Halalkalibacterium halodurans]MED4173650.1 uroporphyrinogen-III synthase [Halalkalibacterium halodurans]BAB05881.1 BH2162 [Halalkalibacterium halodurans C-125]